MAWDPTFDWADASSFNGDARKHQILNEMISQLSAKRNFTVPDGGSPSSPAAVSLGNAFSKPLSYDSTLSLLIPKFLDTINYDWSFWAESDIESIIGSPSPARTPGSIISPSWINWNYQAIEQLVHKCFFTEYWDGLNLSSGAWGDTNFTTRWSTSGLAGSVDPIANQVSLPGGGYSGISTKEFNSLRAMGARLDNFFPEEYTGSQQYTVTFDPDFRTRLCGQGISLFLNDSPGRVLKIDCFNTPTSTYYNPTYWTSAGSILYADSTYFSSGTWRIVQSGSFPSYRTEVYFDGVLQLQFDGDTQIMWGPDTAAFSSDGPLTLGPVEFFYSNGNVR